MHIDPITNIQISKDRQHQARLEASRAHLVRAARAGRPSATSRLRGLLEGLTSRPEPAIQAPSGVAFRDTH